MDLEKTKQAQENVRRLIPIVESIIVVGKQNIPFRGHRDDGFCLSDAGNEASSVNLGNFKELLHFRINSGDTMLKYHLQNTNSKATYISKTVQNQLIDCCGHIIAKVDRSKYYSILFDETTDISQSSQMSVVLRYLDTEHNEICEDFVSFIDCHKDNFTDVNVEPMLTGKILSETVLSV